MKILDCTLRDGGYYTNWDFELDIVNTYVNAMNILPVDYIEIGYRNNASKEYLGKFGYTPRTILCNIRENCNKKIAVMLNEKSTIPSDLIDLLKPIQGLVDMVRIAVDPKNFDRAVVLAESVKSMGFEVGFNTMYMSKWSSSYDGFLQKLPKINGITDLFCMVDSFGGITPEEVADIFSEVKSKTTTPIGFHGHNNLQLGLINTITAKKLGCEYIDATILGMGRGAGNLNMELLLTYLNAHDGLEVDFNVLGDVVASFTPLMEKYHWGTNLPYMIAGANKIPQKEVMEWVTNRVYSFNSVVRALDNRKDNKKDNAKYQLLKTDRKYNTILIIGGGDSVRKHIDGIKTFISSKEEVAVIFSTARHASIFKDINCVKYYSIVGSESRRLSSNVCHNEFKDTVVLPPYPRMMGTEVPKFAESKTYELSQISFINQYLDSCTTLALQTALDLSCGEIYCIGYDGYPGSVLSEKEVTLTNENKAIFEAFEKTYKTKLKSLTPSLYKELDVVSLYQFIKNI